MHRSISSPESRLIFPQDVKVTSPCPEVALIIPIKEESSGLYCVWLQGVFLKLLYIPQRQNADVDEIKNYS